MSTVDPVSQASAYQHMLLAQLGDDDPAEVQRQTPAQWRALIAEAGDHLRKRPAAGEWSVIELLGHAADAELVCAGRYRWIATQDEPPLQPYDQDAWVSGLHHQAAEPESFELTFRLLAGHDRFHLDQARRTLEQVSA